MSRLFFFIIALCFIQNFSYAEGSSDGKKTQSDGRWVNPVTDVCWSCLFPLTVGDVPVAMQANSVKDDGVKGAGSGSSGSQTSTQTGSTSSASVATYSNNNPDTDNPSMPIQICPMGIFYRIGLAIGYWEPFSMVDVTKEAGRMVSMGGMSINLGQIGRGTEDNSIGDVPGNFMQVHWYKYPLIAWLNIITSLGCMQVGDMDLAYMSELDPMWNDSSLSAVINPEAFIFNNIVAQSACAADAIASSFYKPLDVLFWCAGSQGSMYPFTGYTAQAFSPVQNSVLMAERMAYKLHREGLILDSIGENKAVCYNYPAPIIPKDRYRYQMVSMIPDTESCHPFGRSTLRWEIGHNVPIGMKNFGYIIWRKRNCVYL